MYNKTLCFIAALGFLGTSENTGAANETPGAANLCVRCTCDIKVTKEEGTGTKTIAYYNVKKRGVADVVACQMWCDNDAPGWIKQQDPSVKSVGAVVSTKVLGRFPPQPGLESCPD